MNSVALPASAGTQVLSAEADLVRQAARGDAEAFGELFRRHSAPAWRLAQAVTPDRDSAKAAFKVGFARAVKAGRFARRATNDFRLHALASVYRAAIDQTYDSTAAPAAARRTRPGGPEAALADAAFRSLPERWRAAVWLGEVENLEPERIAAVLGVSTSVAEQLVARGRRGLAGRYAQAHQEAPEHVGEVLRPLALAMPAGLADATTSGWASAGSDHLPLFAPVSGWLENRAIRPMSVAAGALIGLGLIGLGVVPGGTAVRSPLSDTSPSTLPGGVPIQSCIGVSCPPGTTGNATTGAARSGGLVSLGGDFLSASFSSGAGAGSGTGGTGVSLTSGLGGSGGSGVSGGSPASGGTSTPSSGATGGGGTGGGGGGTGGGGGVGGSTTLVTLPAGLGSVGTSGSNLTANVGGSGGLTLNAGTSGISGSLGGTPLPTNVLTSPGSATTSASVPNSTTTTTPPQSVTGTVGSVVGGVVGGVTSTVSTLLPGL